ncbi:MAG: hypothetical protein ACTSQE_11070 [Candidatus Heimdallarchaeaceae archaeon]
MNYIFAVPYDTESERKHLINHLFCPHCKNRSIKEIKSYSLVVEDNIAYNCYSLECQHCYRTFNIKFFDTHQLEDLKHYDLS